MNVSLKDEWNRLDWLATFFIIMGIVSAGAELSGYVHSIGLAALNMSIIGFLFAMNRTLTQIDGKLRELIDDLDS